MNGKFGCRQCECEPQDEYCSCLCHEHELVSEQDKTKVKIWNCGHTEDEHCFADTMFCVRDPDWFNKYKEEVNRPSIN